MKEIIEGLTIIAVAIIAWGKVAGIALGLGAIIYICWRLINWFKYLQRIRSCM